MKEVSTDKLKLGLQELERQQNDRKYESERHKLGRILTVIDGCIADPEQRKAAKDLINTIWYEGNFPSNTMNTSLHALLFKTLTGEKLWDETPPKNMAVTQQWNPFEDKIK